MEMHMNFKQQIVIVIGVLAIGCSLLIVPWMTYVPLDTPQGNIAETQYAYRLFNNPPEVPMALSAPKIVWMYQYQKIGLVLMVNALLLFMLRSKKTKKRFVCTTQATAHAAF
jgi:hypothetical protein